MGKSIGSSAGILALVAVLVHTFGSSGDRRPSPPPAEKQAMPALSRPAKNSEVPTAARQGPWRATQQYFHSEPSKKIVDYGACLDLRSNDCSQDKLLALYGLPPAFNTNKVRSLIATVPDPLHTRMAMETDRCLDVIQQAAFRSGYELATQWLPWTAKAAEEKAESADANSSGLDLEKLPGLIVFRPHFMPYSKDVDRLLLIFIVGETPTAGINGFQFELARQAIFGLGSERPNDLLIAGPNFSGSFLSLTRLLEETPGTHHFEVRSGDVSNSDYARAMLVDLNSKGFAIDKVRPGHPSITFHSSALPSTSFHEHFLRLVHKLGLRPEETAELVEDETGFSYTAPQLHVHIADGPPVTYRYPRDIAQLRNMYNDTAFAESPGAETTRTPAVDFSLKDSQSGEDSFPTFSTGHTPVSQNSELAQIAHYLSRRSIRLVSLSATNVFDTLFLANVLARDCPDTRIVLEGADLLFVQEAARGSLSGLMAISPFPLFPEGVEMTHRNASPELENDVTTFANADQIGEFNAVLSLVGTRAANEFHQPFEAAPEDTFSAAWLLVLSPRGWMPVDLFGEVNRTLEVNHQKAQWFDPADASHRTKDYLSGLLRAAPGWTILCALVATFSLAFCFRLFYLKTHPNKQVWSALCLSDLDTPERKRAMSETLHYRYFAMLSCFASLATLNGLLLCPMLVARIRYTMPTGLRMPALLVVVAAFLACLTAFFYVAAVVPVRVCRAGPLDVCPVPAPVSWQSLIWRAGLFAIVVGSLYVWWACCDNGAPGYMLCFRTLTLSAPVCPIWPLTLAVFGLFSLAFFHLRRFTWGDRRQPHLDTSVFDEVLCNEFGSLKQKLEHALISTFGARGLEGLLMLVSATAIFIAALWLLLPAESLSSFEPIGFSLLLKFLLLLLAFYTLVSFLRFGRCWSLLRAFLVNLNSVVIGRYFMRVPEFGGSGPVWIREVKLMSLATAINSCIALHNLEIIQKTPAAYTKDYIGALQNFLCPNGGKGSRLDFICAYEKFRLAASRIATTLGEQILRPYWGKNKLPFVSVAAADEANETAEPKTHSAAEDVFDAVRTGKQGQLKSLTAAVGKIQSFLLESHTAHAQVAVAASPVKNEVSSVSTDAYEQAAKFMALHYSAYVGYALHQLQNLLLCCVACFVLLVGALNSFSFQAPQTIFHLLSAGLIVGGCLVLLVFAQMERDPILSRLSGTAEGELGKDFYIRALAYGALPVFSVLTAQFPAISRYITDWIQPASAALH
ncbi:MAG TPA: hypothetical protein VFA65_03985 [Bryobacteraceae bacterium]|nr:hypothetical protein [Bryobacteraceae bacterium]